jgi:hypothetical protein
VPPLGLVMSCWRHTVALLPTQEVTSSPQRWMMTAQRASVQVTAGQRLVHVTGLAAAMGQPATQNSTEHPHNTVSNDTTTCSPPQHNAVAAQHLQDLVTSAWRDMHLAKLWCVCVCVWEGEGCGRQCHIQHMQEVL